MKIWSIGKQISIGAATTVVLTIFVGGFALYCVKGLQQEASNITEDCLPGVYLICKIESALKSSEMYVRDHLLETEQTKMAADEKQLAAVSATASSLYAEYEATIHTAEDRALFDQMKATRGAYLAARAAVIELSRGGKMADAVTLVQERLVPAYTAYEAAVRAEVEFNKQLSDTYAGQITAGVNKATYGIIIATGLTALMGALAAFVLIRSINSVLRRVVTAVSDGATQVASAATQVSSASQSLASGSSEQAAAVEETSASLEEMAAMTRSNSDNAARANELSQKTRASADAGAAQTEQMRSAMDAIKSSSAAIEKIVNTIEEIAFQTNILALNAAVEAARAGEAGMGFAVVADEVRNLAQRAAHAAQETARKITEAVQRSERGVTISENVARSLTEIVEHARKVDTLVSEIATASREQSQGITQVNGALTQMDKVTQSTASTAEENAAAAEELNAQAAAMQHAIAELEALVDGTRHQSLNDFAAPAPARAAQRRPMPAAGDNFADFTARAARPRPRLDLNGATPNGRGPTTHVGNGAHSNGRVATL
jgi:methyl-accepting chemotaxis protein